MIVWGEILIFASTHREKLCLSKALLGRTVSIEKNSDSALVGFDSVVVILW